MFVCERFLEVESPQESFPAAVGYQDLVKIFMIVICLAWE
jgi:hypothetical protein